MTNTAEAAKFYEQNYNKFFADLYNEFLTTEELELIRNGREIYMNSEELQERLERRAEKLAEEASCEESSQEDGISFPEIVPPQEESPKKPVRKTTAKKK